MMDTIYKLQDVAAKQPDDQKPIEATTTVQQVQVFTLADKQREIDNIGAQITALTDRKALLEQEITDVKTTLNIGVKA